MDDMNLLKYIKSKWRAGKVICYNICGRCAGQRNIKYVKKKKDLSSLNLYQLFKCLKTFSNAKILSIFFCSTQYHF